MIFGDAQHEHLQLNEISLWTGDEKDTGSYRNLADLWLDLTHGTPQSYERRLDIDSAIHSTQYTADGIAFRREYLASAPQQVLILRYTADKSGAYNGTLKLSDAHAARTTAAGNRWWAGGKLANGLQYETVVQLVNSGGRITASEDGLLHIENADSLTILVAAGTNYLADRTRGWRGDPPHERIDRQPRRRGKVLQRLARSARSRLPAAVPPRVEHPAPEDGRLAASYGRAAEGFRWDERPGARGAFRPVRAIPDDRLHRPGTQPAKLQGIWNKETRPPWG